MLRDALGSRTLAISDVANQNVAELVFRLPCDGRATSAPDELSPDKRAELLVELLSRHGADRRERTDPKDLSEHCRILEQRLSLDVERVEARCDDALHGLRQLQLVSPLRIHPHELLRIEGIASGARKEGRLRLCREHGAVEQLSDQASGFVLAERSKRYGHRIAFPAAPAGTPVEQLGPGGTQHQERDTFHPVRKLVDEVQEIVVGPMKVFEDQHERSAVGERLEEAAPSGKGLGPAIPTRFSLAGKPDQG